MKNFNCFLWTVALVISFCFTAIGSAENEEVKLKTYTDYILWTGLDFPEKFDSSLIKDDNSKKAAFKKGLEIFEKKARGDSSIHQETLAVYYSLEKDFKKSLFWAKKCAEQGSNKGMLILADAYFNGEGVVEDFEDGLKWLLLSAATGNEEALKRLNNVKSIKNYEFDSDDLVIRAKKRAKEWMKEHPKAFFDPD